MCSGAVRARGRGSDMVRRAGPIDSSARLDLARRAARPWVPLLRSGRRSDVSLREALAVRGGGAIVRRGRPVDSTARLILNVEQTAPLGLAGGAVRPAVALRRPGVQSDVSLREALRAHETRLFDALRADLRKSPAQAFVSEIGPVLAEIRHAEAKLRSWMKPRRRRMP